MKKYILRLCNNPEDYQQHGSKMCSESLGFNTVGEALVYAKDYCYKKGHTDAHYEIFDRKNKIVESGWCDSIGAEGIKKKSEVDPTAMVDVPEGDITPDDIMGNGGEAGGEDFIGGGDFGGGAGGDGMEFSDNLGEGGPGGQQPAQVDFSGVDIFPTGNLDNIIENQEDFEIDFSKLV